MRLYFLIGMSLALSLSACTKKQEAGANTNAVSDPSTTTSTIVNSKTEPSPPLATSPAATDSFAAGSEGAGQKEKTGGDGPAGEPLKEAATKNDNPAQATPVWHVLSVSGEWTLEGSPSKAISRGDKFSPGSTLRMEHPDNKSHITLVDAGNHTLRKACQEEDCGQQFKLPDVSAGDSLAGRVIDTFLDSLKRHPGKYENLASRGDDELPDAVLELKEGKLDLRPVFGKMRLNHYYLQFQNMKDQNLPVMAYEWDPAASAPLWANVLKPGLYKMNLMSSDDKYSARLGKEAWVLVSPSAQYKQVNASFQSAERVTAQWGDKVDPYLKRSFLRAYLDHLTAKKRRR